MHHFSPQHHLTRLHFSSAADAFVFPQLQMWIRRPFDWRPVGLCRSPKRTERFTGRLNGRKTCFLNPQTSADVLRNDPRVLLFPPAAAVASPPLVLARAPHVPGRGRLSSARVNAELRPPLPDPNTSPPIEAEPPLTS